MARKDRNTQRFTDADLENLKRNVSVLELCRSRGMEFKKHGVHDLKTICPFHAEHEESFIVTPSKNLWHCMGCDAGGSVIDLVMQLDGVTFREAALRLMADTGLVTTATAAASAKGGSASGGKHSASQEEEPSIPPERATQLLERAVTLYEKAMSECPEGLAYLKGRGIDNAEQLTAHRAGYSSGRLRDILPKTGTVLDEIKALGILNRSGHEHLAYCIVFPVLDVDGNLVTLYGRHTGDGDKRHVFLPQRSKGLWNAPIIKTYSELIVVESVLDALSVETAGYPNVIALHGTGGISAGEIADMNQYGVSKLTLLLDGDEAGHKAAERLCERLNQDFEIVIKVMPDGHDPNSFMLAYGKQKLAELIANKQGVLREAAMRASPESRGESARDRGANPETQADDLREHGQTDTPFASQQIGRDGTFTVTCGPRAYRLMGLEKSSRKLKVTIRIEFAGRLHVDTLDLYASRSRRILAGDLCRIFDETPETIEADLSKLIKQCEAVQQRGESDEVGKNPVATMTSTDKSEAQAFGRRPDLIDIILDDYERTGLVGEASNKLLCYLAAVSRKMDEPLSVLVLSSSGAGKTALQDCTLSFVPPEDLVKLTSLSGKALFYKDRLSLKHKVLALEEGDGAEDATYAIRNLISAGELVIESAIKDLATGRLTTMQNRVEGPSSVFITTTDPDTDPGTPRGQA